MTDEIDRIVAGLGPNARQVVKSLDGEFRPSPPNQTRQLTASVALRHPGLIEREWQGGCAQSTYYRLTETGIAARARIKENERG